MFSVTKSDYCDANFHLERIIGNSFGDPKYTPKLSVASATVPNAIFPPALNIIFRLAMILDQILLIRC